MSNKHTNQYVPDYIVTPGEVLADYLASLGMTQAELAARTGLAKKTINEIIKGKSPITHETALKFERALGRPAHFWNNLERQFQEDRIRLAEQQRLESWLGWLKKVPVNTMVKLGWIAKHKDKNDQLEAVLRFFGVASPEQWQEVWQEYQVAYRQTQRFGICAESVSAWLRRGEIEAREIRCAPFDRKCFLEILDEIRDLTRESPDIFVPELGNLAASAGVAVVFVPELPKTGVFGATRWLKGKAVIQLSLRYILKHGRKEIFIEGSGLDGEKEEEANTFARDKLIPATAYRRFLSTWDGRSLEPIQRFAEEISIAPGIVVGRLQHDNCLPKSHGNKLKVFYRWTYAP
ncbi:MAG: HigA family addiction module antidote protein [Deltaproteobacteria bacterium]|nr:HigA family addiction module antidote protein [Deltaproteobacteria bacterium]